VEPKARTALMRALFRQGAVLEAGGKQLDARKVLEEALAIADALHGERPGDATAAKDAADARRDLALTLQQIGETTVALSRVKEGEAILDGLIAGAPENREWRYSRILLASMRSVLLQNPEEAIAAAREAATMAQAAVAANPRDLVALDAAVVMTSRLANRLRDGDHVEESLAPAQQSVALTDQMLALDPDSRRFLYLRGSGGHIVGSSLMKLQRWREAREVLVEGLRFIKRSLAKDREDVRVLQSDNILLVFLTRTERNLGNIQAARERCREAMASAEILMRKNKNAKNPVGFIDSLRSEAKLLGVPDTTLGSK